MQMRGAEMVFAALLAVTCLRRTLNRLHYMGIACCLVHPLSVALVQTKHMPPGVLAARHSLVHI